MRHLSAHRATRVTAATTPENAQTVWARLILATLARGGVREVVVSPGSRSTPFALAATRTEGLRVRAILDERAAAFFALGQARASGRPSVLICTSGSAPAHYLPAVIEASEAGLPLVVLSADRPAEVAGAGAPQATDQVRLFGVHTRAAFDLGRAHAAPSALRGVRRAVAQALAASLGPWPGPVHLNARADKPLEPREPTTDAERELDALGRAIAEEAPAVVAARLAAPPLEDLVAAIARAARPTLVAGPLPLAARGLRPLVRRLVTERGLTLFAEPASQLRFDAAPLAGRADHYGEWVGEEPAADPDLAIELGATATSARYLRFAARDDLARWVLATRPRDPSGTARAVLIGDVAAALEGLLERLPPRAVDRAALEGAERRAAARLAALDRPPLGEAEVARALVRALPAGAILALANSGPIRHVERFARGGEADLRVAAQRGVNGIDGTIAGAAGLADADGGPVGVLLGDVALAHDASSLAIAARARGPLAIVVIDNRGGRIFDTLPIVDAPLSTEERALFHTPPALDAEALARAYGVRFAAVATPEALGAALADALARAGATLVWARVDARDAARIARGMR